MYLATVNAFDVMSSVYVNVSLRVAEPAGEHAVTTVRTYECTFDGTGEPDPEEWLRDVLVALLETL